MADGPKDVDRDILKSQEAHWLDDPEQSLTEVELDRVMKHFSASDKVNDPQLPISIKMQFQIFVDMAMKEGFRERDGKLKKVSKPSTIVSQNMKQLSKTSQTLYRQLGGLDPATRIWLEQHLKEIGVKDVSGERIQLRDFEKHLYWELDHLIHAAQSAEGITSRGPNYFALRDMVEWLAGCWEICHGKPPTTDKGRGRRDEAFLDLCQEVASIAHAKLKAKGGGLGSLKLPFIVDDVLNNRSSVIAETPREK